MSPRVFYRFLKLSSTHQFLVAWRILVCVDPVFPEP